MKVIRKTECEINEQVELKVGDQIQVGSYTATCQKIGKNGAIFMFDQYLDQPHAMNNSGVNEGGYEYSFLKKYLKIFVKESIFDDIRPMMVPFYNGDLLRIPTAEEFFGLEKTHKYYESITNKKQWPLMKDRRNRVAFRGNYQHFDWGWLQNKADNSATSFAIVNPRGGAAIDLASVDIGVRVVFRLSFGYSRKNKLKGKAYNEKTK